MTGPEDSTLPSALPLSESQEGIWLAQRVESARRLYRIGQYVELLGPLDTGAFGHAVRRTAAETEILRMRFREDAAGRVTQHAVEQPEPELPFTDLSAEPDPRAAAEAWMRAELREVTGPVGGALFGFALFRLAPHHHIWYQRYDHLLMDGFACALMARRVADHYTAAVRAETPRAPGHTPLRELWRQEAGYRESEECARDRRYWHDHLADRPEPATAPGRPAPGAGAGVLRATGHLPPAAVTALRTAASRARMSWPRLAVAAVAAFHARLTGATETVLSIPVAGRMNSGARRTPCTMANLLPFRLPVAPGSGLLDLARLAERETTGLLAHQRYRGERIRQELGWPGDGRWHFGPSVNVLPLGDNLRFGESRGIVRDLSSRRVEEWGAVVSGWSDDQGTAITLEANSALYDQDWADARHRSLLGFLERAVADPNAPVGRIRLPGTTASAFPAPPREATSERPVRPVPELVAGRVAAVPEAVAVSGAEGELSYGELGERSGR
ncbi:condensation domain-containing protein, partial [Streptomyces zingiberis]